jgi:Predicted nucleic-acid-binding protein, contains PIN domain
VTVAAIDTNVLVRLVTKDDESQYKKAQTFVERHQPVLVTQLSVLELVWVLMSRYSLNKERTCKVVQALLETRELNIQSPAILEAALKTWGKSKADFADCFILETVIDASESPLGTFDATLGKLEGCKQL